MGKITDQDYFAATSNGDGTHSAVKAAQWLFEAMTGKPMSTEEAEKLVADAKQKALQKRADREAGR